MELSRDEGLEEPRWLGWNGYIGKYATVGLVALSSLITAYSKLGNSAGEARDNQDIGRIMNAPGLNEDITGVKKKSLEELGNGLYALSEEKRNERKGE